MIDLGIARSTENRALRTETGLLRGTLRYLAPELFDGGRYSVQSDLWALGVVLWEALLGRAAVNGSDAVAVGRICSGSIMILEDDEQPDTQVSRAIARLLTKDPTKRPRRAKEAAALFAMVEKSLSGDGDKVVARVVAAAISGVGSFDDVTTGMVAAPAMKKSLLATTESSVPPSMPPPPPTDEISAVIELSAFEPVTTTPTSPEAARGLADYAARLMQMERAHAAAWDLQSADDKERIASLPVITGDLLVETLVGEGATVELDLPPAFPMPPMTPLFLPEMGELLLEEFRLNDDD